jgi:CheY-like chemotaxis protein
MTANIASGKRILIVDDDDSVRGTVKRALEFQKYRVIEAANAKDALELFRGAAFDLVITDFEMPG